jgi:hypothetical protein
MTLLSEASFLVTPNGYKASKLYAAIPTNGNGDMTFTRATTATRVDENDLVSSVASNVPRIDYTGGGCPSILLEPQRTNIVLRSEEFDNNTSFQKNLSSVSANTTTAPDGTLTADTWTGDGTSGVHYLAQTVSATSGVAYTQSVFAKKGTNNFLQILGTVAIYDANSWANFDLENGVVGTVGISATATITDFGNGWYRCTMTATATTTTSGNGFLLWLITSATSARVETNSLATSVHLWGAQLEAGAYPTSYIPTTTASVTRNADAISKTGISDLIGQTEGVLFVESAALFNDLTSRAISISDGSSNNRIFIWYNNISNNITTIVTVAGVSQTSINHVLADETDFAKIAIRYEASDVSLWVNGINRGTVNISIPTVLTKLAFDSGAGVSPFYGKAKQVQLYKTYLSNDEMAALTTL